MDPVTIGLAAGLIGQVGGGLLSFFGSRDEEKAARRMQEEYIKALQSGFVPRPEDFVVNYFQQNPDEYRKLVPVLERQIEMGDTEMANIQLDPKLRQAKMDALQRMTRIGEEGLTAEERVASDQIMRQAGRQAASERESILGSMARRGQLGSGTEIAARMASVGDVYDRAAQDQANLAAQVQKRALEGILGAGKLAGEIEGTDYERQANLAKARDAIAEFNIRNARDIEQRNIAARNQAERDLIALQNRAIDANLERKNRMQEQRTEGYLKSKAAQSEKDINLAQARMAGAKSDLANQQRKMAGLGEAIAGTGKVVQGFYMPNSGLKK